MFEYEQLTKQQQIDQIKGRLTGWEAEHYGNTISLASAEASGEDQAAEQFRRNVKILEASLNVGRQELARLEQE